MKKLLLVALLTISSYVMAQFNPEAPWMKNLNSQESTGRSIQRSNNNLTLAEISAAFNDYWKDKDHTIKGSGYKPFKRWENYIKPILLEDGSVPSTSQLWDNAFEEQRRFGNSSNISNWVSSGPMTERTGQGRVNVATVDPNNPNTYYVGAPSGGLWKSTDKGISWEPLTDHLPAIGVSGIAIDPNDSNIIYIATGDDDHSASYGLGVFKSTDGGRTWNTSATFTPALKTFADAHEIYIHPRNSNILWVATNGGLYKSLDAGSTWNRTFEYNVEDLRLKPNDPDVLYIVGNEYNGAGYAFYKSVDGGLNFTKKSLGTGITGAVARTVIDVTPAAPENVYVLVSQNLSDVPGNEYGGIFLRSENAGEGFREVKRNFMGTNQAWYNLALAVSDTNPDKIAIGTVWGTASNDGGLTFQGINYGHADVHFLRYHDDVLFCGNDGGFITYDSRGTFQDHSKQLDIGQYYRINIGDFSGTNVADIIGGTQDNGGQFFINGAWKRWHGADGMDCALGSVTEGLKFGLMQHGSRLFFKEPGASYTDAISGPEKGEWIVASDINSKDEFYVGYNALYKADIKTRSFEKLHDFGSAIDQVIIDDNNDDVIFVLQRGSVYKSIDAGKSFQIFHDSINGFVRQLDLSEDGSQKVYYTIQDGLFSASTTEATNSNPVLISADLPKHIRVIKHQPYSNIVYAGTQYGVFYKNGDQPWESYGNNLPNVPIYDLEISVEDNTIVAGTFGRGIWKSPIPDGNRTSCALNIPTALNSVIGDKGVLITWNGEKRLEDYEIAYKKVNDRDWKTKEFGFNAALLSNTEVQAGVEYEAKVRSTCNNLYSEYSTSIKFTWTDLEAPTAPSYLYAYDVKKTSAFLSWGESTDNSGISHYNIYNQVGRDAVLLDRTLGAEDYYNIEVLTGSTEYNLYVVAVDFAGNESEASVIVNFTTQSVFMPDAPQNLVTSNNTGTQVTLNWEAPRGSEVVKGYEIYDYQYGLIGTTTETQFVVDNLPSNKWFYVHVKAIGTDDSKSDQSNDVSFIFDGVNDKQPEAPINVTVVDDIYSNFVIRWEAPRGNVAISHYDVYVERAFYLEDYWGGATKVGSTNNTEITITGLEPFSSYWVSVVAVGVEGVNSLPSDVIRVFVEGDPDTIAPTVPVNLRAQNITSSSLELVWNDSRDNVGVAYYEIFETVQGRNVKVGQSRSSNMKIEGLEAFSLHTYQVSATDFEGNTSALSQPIIVATLHKEFPERPYALIAGNITSNSFDAAWRNTRNTDRYYVSSYDGVTIQEFGPLLDNNYKFENIATPFLFWRVISENDLGRMYSSWELTTLDTPRGTIDVVLNGVESQQVVTVSSAYENASYNIFTLNGVSIKRGIVTEGTVNVTALKKGIYILKIANDLKPFTKKVVIQ